VIRTALPIDDILPDVLTALREAPVLILEAAPGAGKTTRVPPAMLDLGPGRILVLQPRRLAARLAAERIAAERGERCGDTVGYHIRLDRVEGPRTRLLFLTEGLFPRYLAVTPDLAGIDAVVLDEFHERHVHTDFALALVRRLQATVRPDLKMVVMSATLDPAPLARWCGDARVIAAPGRTFPVTVEHAAAPSRLPLERQVRGAVADLLADPRCPGHILVFLAGAADIRRSGEALSDLARRAGADLLPLRAELPIADQLKVFAPSDRRKIVLATNVAETSVTIDGVTGVVDSGLAKIPGHAPWSGLPTLDVQPVSQAAGVQRAGRAGRTAPGVARRLYTAADFAARSAAEAPEITRVDLTPLLLDLHRLAPRLGLAEPVDPSALPWYAPPPAPQVAAAEAVLRLLGAVDADGRITPAGEAMAAIPLHPRLARAVVEGRRLGAAGPAALAAVLVGEGMILRRGEPAPAVAASDVAFQTELYQDLQARRPVPAACRALVDPQRVRQVAAVCADLFPRLGLPPAAAADPVDEEALARCFLAGFPDRVARARRGTPRGGRSAGPPELTLCLGGGARLSESSVARDEDFLVALAAEARMTADAARAARVHLAVGVAPWMLLDAPPGLLEETAECGWDERAARARGVRRLRYGQLVLEETPLAGAADALEQVLARELAARWPQPFPDDDALRRYAGRRELALATGCPAALPDLAGPDFPRLLAAIATGRTAFAEVAARPLAEHLRQQVDPAAWRLLEEWAPETVTIGAGRRVPVQYASGQEPWIASRLQDFFGTAATPTVGRGRVRLVVRLLAPNRHALQVTDDLAGFWARTYPALRREYARRYPRHSWPDDPLTARPPERGRAR
jgi:ATP-dependent helicase HrpB